MEFEASDWKFEEFVVVGGGSKHFIWACNCCGSEFRVGFVGFPGQVATLLLNPKKEKDLDQK